MKSLLLTLIKGYQKYLSPRFSTGVCRYQPTCSVYAYEAIERYGIIKGSFLAVKRIGRCNPFAHGGFDPVV